MNYGNIWSKIENRTKNVSKRTATRPNRRQKPKATHGSSTQREKSVGVKHVLWALNPPLKPLANVEKTHSNPHSKTRFKICPRLMSD